MFRFKLVGKDIGSREGGSWRARMHACSKKGEEEVLEIFLCSMVLKSSAVTPVKFIRRNQTRT